MKWHTFAAQVLIILAALPGVIAVLSQGGVHISVGVVSAIGTVAGVANYLIKSPLTSGSTSSGSSTTNSDQAS
jgi:hypothetical protein